jgi:hypothetical protein
LMNYYSIIIKLINKKINKKEPKHTYIA